MRWFVCSPRCLVVVWRIVSSRVLQGLGGSQQRTQVNALSLCLPVSSILLGSHTHTRSQLNNNLINVSYFLSSVDVDIGFYLYYVLTLPYTFSFTVTHLVRRIFTVLSIFPSSSYPLASLPSTVYAGNHLCRHFHPYFDTIHLSFPPTPS